MNYSNSTISNFDSSRLFNINQIKKLIENIIEEKLNDETEYDSNKSIDLSKELSQIIKDAIKTLNYHQYKYIIQVVIGQCQNENLMMTCRCLWDIQTDNYASYIYSNAKIFCAVTVFGLFYY